MGNQKWSAEEEEALRAGVAKHGTGRWKVIQNDPQFTPYLSSRTNIDLKDKWRNLHVTSSQRLRDASKASPADAPATPVTSLSTVKTSAASISSSSQDASTDVDRADFLRSLPEGNSATKYNGVIYETISTLNEPNGSACRAIAAYIEQRYVVPQNFKRVVSSRLKRLVQQNKLEKVENCYRIKGNAQLDLKEPDVSPKDPQPEQVQDIGYLGNMIVGAAASAAHAVAEADNKSLLAAEGAEEAERISKMAEESEAFLQFAFDCCEKCENGEIIQLA